MHIPLKQLPARSPVCSLLFWLPQPSSPSRKELQPELCPSARPFCSRAACKYTPSYEDAISLSSSVNFAALRMARGCCQEKAAWEREKKNLQTLAWCSDSCQARGQGGEGNR